MMPVICGVKSERKGSYTVASGKVTSSRAARSKLHGPNPISRCWTSYLESFLPILADDPSVPSNTLELVMTLW